MEHVHAAVAYGSPASAIVDRAHHTRADLVVLGCQHRVGDAPKFLGTTAERVVARSTSSVLLAATPPTGAYRRPLIAIELPDAFHAMADLVARIGPPECVVEVLHVVAHQRDVARALERLLALLRSTEVARNWIPIIEIGAPGDVIVRVARIRGADLIAVGTRRLGHLPEWITGSVARAVMREAAIDVLVAR